MQKSIRPDSREISTAPPFRPRTKRILESALRESLQLGYSYIGPEHLLLGIIDENDGVACQVLVSSGVDLGELRRNTLSAISTETNLESDDGSEVYETDPYRVLRSLWRLGMIRLPKRPEEQVLWDKMEDEFGEPGEASPS